MLHRITLSMTARVSIIWSSYCAQYVMSTVGDISIQNLEIPHYTAFRIGMTTSEKHQSKQTSGNYL